jgi:hypothetical protein
MNFFLTFFLFKLKIFFKKKQINLFLYNLLLILIFKLIKYIKNILNSLLHSKIIN